MKKYPIKYTYQDYVVGEKVEILNYVNEAGGDFEPRIEGIATLHRDTHHKTPDGFPIWMVWIGAYNRPQRRILFPPECIARAKEVIVLGHNTLNVTTAKQKPVKICRAFKL